MDNYSEDEEMVFLNKTIDSFTESGYTGYVVLISKDVSRVKYISNFHLLEKPEPLNSHLFSLASFLWHKFFKISGFLKHLSDTGQATIITHNKFQVPATNIPNN